MALNHRPVLYQEIITALRPHRGACYVDGTLEASTPDGLLLGLDLDPQALELARQRLAPFGGRARIVQASYTSLPAQLEQLGWGPVDGILLDLGASSLQFDAPERGFSFLADGPLDMRFDPHSPLTADEIVNRWEEAELADLLFRFGEEPAARRIARAIVSARPIGGTRQLAQLIEMLQPRRGPRHPATRTFQALRIAVNDELGSIEKALPQSVAALKPGGRLAVIAFHSLEDRRVKEYFRQESRDCLCPPRQPVCTCGHRASIKEITRRPVVPTEAELQDNPRARSAKLRVAEKLASA
jgi:16S rRNA (cytosine1402-N4)-methyltransferase